MFEAAGPNRELTRLRVQTRDLQDYGAKRKQWQLRGVAPMAQLQTKNSVEAFLSYRLVYTSGQTLGIIAVDLDYPKVPGNVVNATTYDFPVLYEMVSFEIEQLLWVDACY